jgi:hypothetical protein
MPAGTVPVPIDAVTGKREAGGYCWVKRRYCLAGITKLGERVAGITKLE